MKKIFKQTLLFAALAAIAGGAAAQITSTPHNLSSGGTGANHVTGTTAETGTTQICVFCHTPHGADTTAPAPLWNKALPAGADFKTYDDIKSSTIDGKILAVGSVSLACLSCHDGTQAMDNIINAPGSGGLTTGGGVNGLNYTWTTGGSVSTTGQLTGVAALGDGSKDLSNDHPIGIQYCGGGVTGAADAVTANCADLDFRTTELRTKSINGQQAFWVDLGTAANQRDKGDIILYTRDFGTAGTPAVGPSVECASCHDPHSSKTTTSSDVNFMRVTTAGSAICLACHVK
ncbi:cytochrome c3 family protein [Aromatoleum evansii]|uniref:Cytochrome c3 family protein n=1 Tax=Aromatoleum evansii TaxID=59406 RepID=A0ABZ1AQH3_AROEV|nr:cytochrome c3 family protein [Aromatoleum evansii]